AINRFIFANDGRRINLVVDGVAGRQVHGSDVIARAGGGAVYGPGTSTSDSVPAMLSTGEHVLTAADVAAMGGQNAVYAFRSALHSGGGGATAATATQQGPATFNLFDADGVLIGTMRGEIAASNAAQARVDNAGVRRRFGSCHTHQSSPRSRTRTRPPARRCTPRR